MQKLENLIELLSQKSINYHDFLSKANTIHQITDLFDPKDLDMWCALGINIVKLDNGKITLKSRQTNILDEIFCIIDVETNGGINNGQIIEIGAIKLQNNKIIDKFQSFIYAKEIPQNIIELTQIYPNDLKNAPNLAQVMEKFKLFLSDSIFVAHNVKFDYSFINKSFENLGFGMILNRKICTIDLARRTIASPKYGLSTLKELLQIDNTHHRALNDAISCAQIFKECLKRIPQNIQTTEELIKFSKTTPNFKMPKNTQN